MNIRTLLFVASLSLPACTPPPPVGDVADALTIAIPLDLRQGAQIVGASADRRRIAYAAPCDPESTPPATLRLFDVGTGRSLALGTLDECRPDAVQFSSDGGLAAIVRGAGVVDVWSARNGALVTVSRSGNPTIGFVFSPGGRWFLVASALDAPATAALDAWDADLSHHVEIASNAYFSPFGPPTQSLQLSADGSRLLFLADATVPYPLGALTLWDHDRGAASVLAHGVASFKASDDFRDIAFLDGVVYAEGPPSSWLHGRLAVLADGRLSVIARDVSATPQLFAPDGTLVYLLGVPGGPGTPMTLMSAAPGAAPVTLDGDVFSGLPPFPGVALAGDGRTLAYMTAFDPMHFDGALHATTLPARGASPSATRVIAPDAVPAGFGWVDQALVYLHAPTSGFPFAEVGTLAAWRADGGSSAAIAEQVAQTGLRFDDAAGRALFVAGWDAARAAGNLMRWSARGGGATLVARDAFAMATQTSPDDRRAGVVTLGTPPAAGEPPPTTLWLAPLDGGAAKKVANATTSFVVGDGGLTFYTTAAGLFGAVTR